MSMYKEMRAQRAVEDRLRDDLITEALKFEASASTLSARIEEVQRAASAEIERLTQEARVSESEAQRLRRKAADVSLRIDAMDVLLMDAPDEAPDQPSEAKVQLNTWLKAHLQQHRGSDFTLHQLEAAARKACVAETSSALRDRIRATLHQATKAGTILRRESSRGSAWMAA